MAFTRRSGCVAVKVPAPPRRLDGEVIEGFLEVRSELSRPMIGTICVSGLGCGSDAGAPK